MHALEQDLGAQATVLRLDIFSDDGRAFFKRYGLTSTPALVVLDPSARIRYASNGALPDEGRVKQALAEIAGEQ